MLLNVLLLMLGNFAAATSVIFIKASETHPVLLASYRLFFAALLLTPVFFREAKRHGVTVNGDLIRPSILPGIILSLHFVTWILGARLTLAANATLIVNMVPVAMPFLVYFIAKEVIRGVEIAGTLLALLGMLILTGRDFQIGQETFLGDLVCFVSMLLLALYMALGKKNNRQPSIWLYVVPLYYAGAFFAFIISLFMTSPAAQPFTVTEVVSILGLAFIPTIVGHSIFNHAMKILRSQLVSLMAMTQFIYATFLAYLFFGEIPRPILLPATALILAGTAVNILYGSRLKRQRSRFR